LAQFLFLETTARESIKIHNLDKPMRRKLLEPTTRQCDLRTGWRAKVEDENVDRANPNGLGDIASEGDPWTAVNVQKKIMPWEQGLDQGLVYTETQRLAGMPSLVGNASVSMMTYSSPQRAC
jgi:hypothetical protein